MLTSNDIEFIKESSKDLSIEQLCQILKVDKKDIKAYIPSKNKIKCLNARNVDEFSICVKCGDKKHKLEFSIDSKKKNGLKSWCKNCFNENTKNLYKQKVFSLESAYQLREIKQKRKYAPLTDSDKDYIKENASKMSLKAISEKLNKSLYSVRKYSYELFGKKIDPIYTKINRDLIKKFVSESKTADEMSNSLDMDISTFRQYLIYLGISLVELKKEITAELLQAGLTDIQIRQKLDISTPALWARKNDLKKNSQNIIKNNILNSLVMVKMPLSKDVIKNREIIENKLNELLELIEKGA